MSDFIYLKHLDSLIESKIDDEIFGPSNLIESWLFNLNLPPYFSIELSDEYSSNSVRITVFNKNDNSTRIFDVTVDFTVSVKEVESE